MLSSVEVVYQTQVVRAFWFGWPTQQHTTNQILKTFRFLSVPARGPKSRSRPWRLCRASRRTQSQRTSARGTLRPWMEWSGVYGVYGPRKQDSSREVVSRRNINIALQKCQCQKEIARTNKTSSMAITCSNKFHNTNYNYAEWHACLSVSECMDGCILCTFVQPCP